MPQHEEPPRRTQDPKRVFWARVKAGLEQRELAARVGISAAQMSRIETGKNSASVETLHKIAKELGCDVTDLMPAEAAAS